MVYFFAVGFIIGCCFSFIKFAKSKFLGISLSALCGANRRFVPCQVVYVLEKTEIVRAWADFDASLAISGYIQQNRCIGILIDVLRK